MTLTTQKCLTVALFASLPFAGPGGCRDDERARAPGSPDTKPSPATQPLPATAPATGPAARADAPSGGGAPGGSGSSGTAAAAEGDPGGRPAARHFISDDKLRGVMKVIAAGKDKWPKGLPEDPETPEAKEAGKAFADAAKQAAALAETAKLIPRAIEGKELAADVREGFLAEAKTLGDKAGELRAAAEGRKVEQMQRLMDQVNGTCIACHSKYRDLSGAINFPQARGHEGGPETLRALAARLLPVE